MVQKTNYGQLITLAITILFLSTAICSAQTVNYAYDELNRLKQVEHTDGSMTEFAYDNTGNRLQTQVLHLCTITVAKTGTGSGTVTGQGFDCGSDCFESAYSGLVVLTATPADNAFFAGWSGCDTPNGNQCTMNYDATKTVSAIFSLKPRLTVTRAGTQQGVITSSPAGIDCGSACSSIFDPGTPVTLTTTVPPDYHVVWTGCTANGITCTLTMGTSDTTISASYVMDPLVTITKSGTQQGIVTSSPAGIDCGSACSDYFPVDTNITLSSTLPSGYCVAWTGCIPNYASCSLNVETSNKSVAAAYQTNRRLIVSRTGSSKKTITSSPAGISCGIDCEEVYPQGTAITLTSATPSNKMHVEWAGCTVNPSNPLQCSYTMDCTDRTVTANFANNHTLTVTKSPTAGGTVTSTPTGITCGSTCSATYGDTLVTLTATPATGYTFTGWSGCDSTNGNTCTVTVNANKTVTATFGR